MPLSSTEYVCTFKYRNITQKHLNANLCSAFLTFKSVNDEGASFQDILLNVVFIIKMSRATLAKNCFMPLHSYLSVTCK